MTSQKEIFSVSADDREWLTEVALLHIDLLSFGPMSPFGTDFVRVVGYELPIRDGLMQLACIKIDGQIVGFIAYAQDAQNFYKAALSQHIVRTAWMTIRALFARPTRVAALLRAIKVAKDRSGNCQIEKNTAEITAIAVRPEFSDAEFVRRTGIRASRELVTHALRKVAQGGAKRLRGVIDGFNKPAVMMFGQLGAEISNFEQAGEPMYAIVLDVQAD